jgi:hypothetical protein
MLLGEPLDGAGKRLCAREIRRPGQLRELADRRRCEAFSGARRRAARKVRCRSTFPARGAK